MAYSLKENLMKEDRLSGGHRMCAGCGSPIAVRTVLRALNPEDKAVVCSATSCLEVSTFMYPYTAWKDSFIHNAFENAAATISGVTADTAGAAAGAGIAGAAVFASVLRTTLLMTETRTMMQIRPTNTVHSPIRHTNKLE